MLAYVVRRFIPACAGNTCPGTCRADPPPVHPRVCGEHRCYHRLQGHVHGSSPRVRGTPRSGSRQQCAARFIPACAGNTSSAVRRCAMLAGSSPRVRGTRGNEDPCRNAGRFIPACAGNTHKRTKRGHLSAVHPRVCGEHARRVKPTCAPAGSSPRVRGTPPLVLPPPNAARFIPACAGNTVVRLLIVGATSVHPRVCGEHAGLNRSYLRKTGSSPRVRGTRVVLGSW
ncbi:Domain of uncharacterised function (DUF2825) [Pannonibacter phragmitetus]|uniref:Domain of uncharacterized function (DUF2825) n=1 Tax=Pannonibacter phragmitetus TaxID=121719 RepID=A0A378ZWP4_9HYPH|nr:Domain of uncharacterised function (DUF2825) [Pannonibacter phragmitetus]